MKLITLKTFGNPIDSHLYKSILEDRDIRCYLFDENMVSLNLLHDIMIGGIKLKINASDFEKAKKIIQEIEAQPIKDKNNKIVSCPNCQSTDIISDFKSVKSLSGFFSMLIALLFTTYPLFYKNLYKCKKCGTEFEIKNH